jgi:hypothetical protein
MKKLFALLLSCALLVAGIPALAEEPAPTTAPPSAPRGISWGMTADEIIAVEGDKTITAQGDDLLVYDGLSVSGLDAAAVYSFNSAGECYQLMYLFSEAHSDDNAYIRDFDKLTEALTGIYGEPTNSGQIWYNELFKADASRYGLAVSAGHLRYISIFETEHVKITNHLHGDNYTITHVLQYASKTVAPKTTTPDNSL